VQGRMADGAVVCRDGRAATRRAGGATAHNGISSPNFFCFAQTLIRDEPQAMFPISFKCEMQQRRHALFSSQMRLEAHQAFLRSALIIS
jgi:hypothetical protein